MVRVVPNAHADRIEGVETRADGSMALKIRVVAPPDKGVANGAVIALLAKALGVPESAFAIVSGETARSKVLAIAGVADEIEEALLALAG